MSKYICTTSRLERSVTFQSQSLSLGAILLDMQRPLRNLNGCRRFCLFDFEVPELFLQASEFRVCLCNFGTEFIQRSTARLR